MIHGARRGAWSGLRRLTARAQAQMLAAIVVPGPEVAAALGLDLAGAGLLPAASPRHASVLVVAGALPAQLREAAAVLYAQMMRPRAVMALGAGTLAPLPGADVVAELSQPALLDAVRRLRRAIAGGAFRRDAAGFDAPVLRSRTEYVCPMHPEVVRDEPGSCPKCGMTLVPREAQDEGGHAPDAVDASTGMEMEAGRGGGESAYTCPMHPEVVRDEPGSCPKCGMTLVPREAQDEGGHAPDAVDASTGMEMEAGRGGGESAYTCPMHPEVVRDEPGSCPKCGMTLVPRAAAAKDAPEAGHAADAASEAAGGRHAPMDPSGAEHSAAAHTGMDHGAMDHVAGHSTFMSMVAVTRDLPRSPDGLPMDWIEVPFGPLFPGLPGGLSLVLTLDGDTVAGAAAQAPVAAAAAAVADAGGRGLPAAEFARRLGAMDPLAPVAYRLLARRALECAAGVEPDSRGARARAGAAERERLASHLAWLAVFLGRLGLEVHARRSWGLAASMRGADAARIAGLAAAVRVLVRGVRRTPLLETRLAGIGRLAADGRLRGPVARAAGVAADGRVGDPVYGALGFEPVTRPDGDARARLAVRLDEIEQSLRLVRAAGVLDDSGVPGIGAASGTGEALVETPRGGARLAVSVERGRVTAARLDTPSTVLLERIGSLVAQCELGDALTAVASLDLSPWEVVA